MDHEGVLLMSGGNRPPQIGTASTMRQSGKLCLFYCWLIVCGKSQTDIVVYQKFDCLVMLCRESGWQSNLLQPHFHFHQIIRDESSEGLCDLWILSGGVKNKLAILVCSLDRQTRHSWSPMNSLVFEVKSDLLTKMMTFLKLLFLHAWLLTSRKVQSYQMISISIFKS